MWTLPSSLLADRLLQSMLTASLFPITRFRARIGKAHTSCHASSVYIPLPHHSFMTYKTIMVCIK
jgi:hypothetical protein